MKEYQRERLAIEITELISHLMDEQGVSRAELASRLGKSRAYVTKLLRHGSNLTVQTISDVFHALGRSLRVVDRPLSVSSPALTVTDEPTPKPTRRSPPGERSANGAAMRARPRRAQGHS
jgi:transcriptional regulator with XRE-family HTH domain